MELGRKGDKGQLHEVATGTFYSHQQWRKSKVTAICRFVYPCFMWLLTKKLEKYSACWYLNSRLGILGSMLSIAFTMGEIWSIVDTSLNLKFFNLG